MVQAGRRPDRRGRGALRGLDRQGRLRGAVAGVRAPHRDPGARGRHRRRRHRASPWSATQRRPGGGAGTGRRGSRRPSRPPAPAPAPAPRPLRRPLPRPRLLRLRLRPRRPAPAAPAPRRRAGEALRACCCRRSCAGWSTSTASTPRPITGTGRRAHHPGRRRAGHPVRRGPGPHGRGAGRRARRPLRPPAAAAALRPRRRAAPAPRSRHRRHRRAAQQHPAPHRRAHGDVEGRRRRTPTRSSRSTTRTSSGCVGATATSFEGQEGFSLTYLPFISRAVIDALRDFPHMNATRGRRRARRAQLREPRRSPSTSTSRACWPRSIHEADDKRLRAIARDINDLATRARTKKLSADDITGGTFTLSNSGSFGTLPGAADHQPAAGRDPLHRRRAPQAGGGHRRRRHRGHRHPLGRPARP